MSDGAQTRGNTYRYYRLGNRVPVRVTLDASGRKLGAETTEPGADRLVIKNTLLSRIETSPDAEEISRQDFAELVRRSAENA